MKPMKGVMLDQKTRLGQVTTDQYPANLMIQLDVFFEAGSVPDH